MKTRKALHRAIATTVFASITLSLSSCTELVEDPSGGPITTMEPSQVELPAGTEGRSGQPKQLGETVDAVLSAFIDPEGEICLEAKRKGLDDRDTSCLPAQQFSQRGLAVELHGLGYNYEAYFAPEGMSAETYPQGLEEISPNLVAGNAEGVDGPVRFVSTGNGSGATFIEIPRPLSDVP